MSMGTIGIYIGKMYVEVKHRPLYNIKEFLDWLWLLEFHFKNVYYSSIRRLFGQNGYSFYELYSFAVIDMYFITAVILDRMRTVLWNRIDMELFTNDEDRK